jgi:hypothetical protein
LEVIEKSDNALNYTKLRIVFREESKHLVSATDELAD